MLLKDAYTVALVKSAAAARGAALPITAEIVDRGFVIEKMVSRKLCPTEAKAFYHAHMGRTYTDALIDSVTSGPITAYILTRRVQTECPITLWREAIGSSNSALAAEGTIRSLHGGHNFRPNAPIADNAVHGSDSSEAAKFEAMLIFGSSWRDDTTLFGDVVRSAVDSVANVAQPYLANDEDAHAYLMHVETLREELGLL